MKRYKKFVLEAEKGIIFEVSEETSEELIIRALNIDKARACSENLPVPEEFKHVCGEWHYANLPVPEGFKHVCREWHYANLPIPEGYKYVCGEWNNGFVIKRCSDGSEFVWIPVASLNSNGTLNETSFNQKFWRRNYQNDKFFKGKFHETLEGELALQLESVNKYGGFYISRYEISRNKETGNPQSVKGKLPWVHVDFNEAKKVAAMLERSDTITSHLTFGAEYDSMLEWFIKTEAKTYREVVMVSKKWEEQEIIPITGSQEECVNNIYDLGNLCEWTQEQGCHDINNNAIYRVVRGGSPDWEYPIADRTRLYPDNIFSCVGFRAALYIK